MDDDLDRIDRQIDIDASAERVWELVSRPGWYVNQGAVVSNPVLETDGDVTVLRHPEYGDWRFRTVTLEEPRYAAFRWLGDDEQSTLVEFWIDEREDTGVTLRVVESGLASLGDPDWLRKREENVEGWESELVAAAAYARPDEVHRAVDVAATPDQVWPLLTTPEGLEQWGASDLVVARTTDGEPRTVELSAPAMSSLRVTAAGPGSTVVVQQTGPADGAAREWERRLLRLVEVAARVDTPV